MHVLVIVIYDLRIEPSIPEQLYRKDERNILWFFVPRFQRPFSKGWKFWKFTFNVVPDSISIAKIILFFDYYVSKNPASNRYDTSRIFGKPLKTVKMEIRGRSLLDASCLCCHRLKLAKPPSCSIPLLNNKFESGHGSIAFYLSMAFLHSLAPRLHFDWLYGKSHGILYK